MARLKSRIEEARDILENKTLASILDERAKDIHSRWETSNDPAGREACWTELHALKELRDAINAAATRIESEPVI